MTEVDSLSPTRPSVVPQPDLEDRAIDAIVARGPGGTFAVAGLATAIVIAHYLAFYVFAYLPRGIVR